MKIPIYHYIKIWVINSFLALATGVVVGYMLNGIFFFLAPILTFPIGFSIYGQYVIANLFWGDQRGAFEFSYLERRAEKDENNPEFAKLLRKVKEEYKLGDPVSAMNLLKGASKDYATNFVAHFKYAISCEKLGEGDEAINSYESASNACPEGNETLLKYVMSQIERVRSKGPRRKSTAPGLQYIIY